LQEVEEQVDFGNRLLSYRLRSGDSTFEICSIAPCRSHVELRFPRGRDLPDPEHLLAGCGSGDRRVLVETVESIGRPGIAGLLRTAARSVPAAGAGGG
jgi:hypothetical protein